MTKIHMIFTLLRCTDPQATGVIHEKNYSQKSARFVSAIEVLVILVKIIRETAEVAICILV